MGDSTFLVLDPGPFSTVQDMGRFGHQGLGVPVSGALDSYSARVANFLVGNSSEEAVLEMTVRGCSLAVLRPAWVAIAGARAQVRLNSLPISGWSSFAVEAGDLLRIGQVELGCRIYLAINGGLDVPRILGSRSTYAPASLGGLQGRALRKGDFLPSGTGGSPPERTGVPEELVPEMGGGITLRCVPGPQEDMFEDSGHGLFRSEYSVTQRTDRRGIRLQGPAIEHSHHSPGGIVSEPVLPGNIQVPGDGQPIVLLREQTVGGYPKIATVISSDLSRLGQVVPGDRLSFEPVDLDTARQIGRRSEERLSILHRWLWGHEC